MGQNESQLQDGGDFTPEIDGHDYERNDRVPIKYSKMDQADIGGFYVEDDFHETETQMPEAKLTNMPYSGIWSIWAASSSTPLPRSQHFTANSEETGCMYIGYGLSKQKTFLDDVWEFRIKERIWRQIPLKGKKFCGRAGASACMMGQYIVIFGGHDQSRYFNDLHTIDVVSGEVIVTPTRNMPTPRKNVAIGLWDGKLFIYGGTNKKICYSDYYVMSFNTMAFRAVQTEFVPRKKTPFCQQGDKLMTFPSNQKADFILVLDMSNEQIQLVQTKGTPPPPNINSASIALTKDYLFYIGGDDKWSYTYCMCLKRLFWFIFFTEPDGITISPEDGLITPEGIFVIPRSHSFSTYYDAKNRNISIFLGFPQINPVPIYTLFIGEGTAVCNLREDLLLAMYETQ